MAITKHMLVLLISVWVCHCANAQKVAMKTKTLRNVTIECNDNGCFGSYYGREFINGSDVAHQFSNTMSAKVGDKLKELHSQDKYVKVDFENIYVYHGHGFWRGDV